jgi:hypothetical protein
MVCQEHYPETNLLRQVEGIGVLTALTFVLTLEDPSRFAKSRSVGAYPWGLCPPETTQGIEILRNASSTILSATPIGAKNGRGKWLNERGDEAEAKLCQREEVSVTGTRAATTLKSGGWPRLFLPDRFGSLMKVSAPYGLGPSSTRRDRSEDCSTWLVVRKRWISSYAPSHHRREWTH